MSVELSQEEVAAFLRWMHDPPDECDHGFTPPDDCPNDECDDRVMRALWFRLRYDETVAPAVAEEGDDYPEPRP